MGGFRTLLLAGAATVLSCAGAAVAQEAAPAQELRGRADLALDLTVRQDALPRFAMDAPFYAAAPAERAIELELAAGGSDSPIDVAIARRQTLASGDTGQLGRTGAGSELRVGRGLVNRRETERNGSAVYAFVSSDDEALTWQPGARSAFGGRGEALTLQDQVEVGDVAAGVTYERDGVRASLAYVEREESARVGQESFSQDQTFAGVTVTMRR